jgi:hypothetical protein
MAGMNLVLKARRVKEQEGEQEGEIMAALGFAPFERTGAK